MTNTPRSARLEELKLESNPLAPILTSLYAIIKSSYPDLIATINPKQDKQDIKTRTKLKHKVNSKVKYWQIEVKTDAKTLHASQQHCNASIDALIAIETENRTSHPQNTPFNSIANPNNHDKSLIKAAKVGKLSARAALFGWLLRRDLGHHDGRLCLLGLLLTHQDTAVQQQLDTLTPLARYYLALQLLKQSHYTDIRHSGEHGFYLQQSDVTPLQQQPFAQLVNTLAEQQSGYLLINPWQDVELLPVLWLMYADFKASLLPQVWQDIWLRPYQESYSRRSFRQPHNVFLLAYNALDVMRNCSAPASSYTYGDDTSYYALSFSDYVRFGDTFSIYNGFHPYLLAAALDNESDNDLATPNHLDVASVADIIGTDDVLALCHNIIHQQDDLGRVSRMLLKGMLSSRNPQAWQLVVDLLLAAQRQEGLRQTVIESLDEAHPDTLGFVIDIILAHNLTRFSSVVRGLDVWSGLVWEGERASTVKQLLGYASDAFAVATEATASNTTEDNHSEVSIDAIQASQQITAIATTAALENRVQRLQAAMPKWLASRNNGQIYMVLWVLGCYDVTQTIPYLAALIADKVADRACLAAHFLAQIKLPQFSVPLLYQMCLRDELKAQAYAFTYLSHLDILDYRYHLTPSQRITLFKHCQHLVQTLGKNFTKTFAGNVFSGISAMLSSEVLYQLMINLAVIAAIDKPDGNGKKDSAKKDSTLTADATDLMAQLLGEIEDMPLSCRERLTRLMLGQYYIYHRSYQNDDETDAAAAPTRAQKQFALQMLGDRGDTIQLSATQTLKAVDQLQDNDIEQLQRLLGKKSTRIKTSVLQVLLAQPQAVIMQSLQGLLLSTQSQQRVAGLELLWHLFDKERFSNDKLGTWITEYQQFLVKQAIKPIKAELQQLERCQTKAEQVGAQSNEGVLSIENGWGLYNPDNLHSSDLPELAEDNAYLKYNQQASHLDNSYANNSHANSSNSKMGLAQTLKKVIAGMSKTAAKQGATQTNAANAANTIVHTQFSKPIAQINADLAQLHALFVSHQHHEYSYETYHGREDGILANGIYAQVKDLKFPDLTQPDLSADDKADLIAQYHRQQFENYPLYEVWEQWYQQAGWQPYDLFLITLTQDIKDSLQDESTVEEITVFKPLYSPFFYIDELTLPCFQKQQGYWRSRNFILSIIDILANFYKFSEKNEFFIGLTTQFFNALPKTLLTRNFKDEPIARKQNQYLYNHYQNTIEGWQSEPLFSQLLERINEDSLTDSQVKLVWQLWRWRQYAGLAKDSLYLQPSLTLTAQAYQQGLINNDEMMAVILNSSSTLRKIQQDQVYCKPQAFNVAVTFPFLIDFVEAIIEKVLHVESQRGELATPMTHFATQIERIEDTTLKTIMDDTALATSVVAAHDNSLHQAYKTEAARYDTDALIPSRTHSHAQLSRAHLNTHTDSIAVLTTLLTHLAKTGFYANTIYGWSDNLSKKELFSKLVAACYPVYSSYPVAVLSKATDNKAKESETLDIEAKNTSDNVQASADLDFHTTTAQNAAPAAQVTQTTDNDDDWQHRFNAAVTEANFNDKLLVGLAMYARQWQTLVANHLQWPGLKSGIYWLIAHTKISDYQEANANDESAIARYSNIELAEFKRGAVDIDWFHNAYSELGRKRWEVLYDCAKYISGGNGHRRAKLYSDVLTGDLKIREVTKKVKDKRDQDHVRLFGLVPLSKTNPQKDVLSRYHTLVQFKKDSKQFGSQRQQSEGAAVDISLENLARNAGFTDPQRLTWAMETETLQQILAGDTTFVDGEVSVSLRIDAQGRAQLDVMRGDKPLKSIPAKYKKDKGIAILKAHKKTLTQQFKRARHSFEMAMVRGDEFSAAELATLFEHPVIGKHLDKLVFVAKSDKSNPKVQLGFYKAATVNKPCAYLEDTTGKRFNLSDSLSNNLLNNSADGLTQSIGTDIKLRIAHCVDLQQAHVWPEYQHYCFEQQIVQPFKQIFRELYVPTPDELAAKSVSRRYAGHQVQPAKTVALLKSRGWRADYEEGLQKVNHRLGFRVKMYALADWFTPADVESPTLETVIFENLHTGKVIDFVDIEPRAFSEAMRDLDLVVSVANASGVEVSTSQSSIALRGILVSESMRLFKQDNVEVKERHALVKGSLAEYSVHLGSAVVHQIGGSYLSILPVHSQHRGKVFLPFMDDDPKTAELISKVLLLARDEKIQDPTILRQIS